MNKLLYITAMLLAFASCQNEEIATNGAEVSINTNKIELVEIIDGKHFASINENARTIASNTNYALRFDSEATYKSFLKQVEDMSYEEKLTLASKYGLTSLQEISKLADIELDSILERATSEGDFNEKYAEYKEKYEGILIGNPYNSKDISLYVPEGDKELTYLVGESRTFVINDKINEVDLSDDLGKSDKAITLFDINYKAGKLENENGFVIEEGSKKTIFSVNLQSNLFLDTHVGAQKKTWYGTWKRDSHRDFFYHLALDNFTYNFWGPYGHQINIICPDLYVFYSTGNYNYNTGYLTGGPRTLKGKAYVWTDMKTDDQLVEYLVVVGTESKFERRNLRKCDRNKAYVANIDLTL